MKAIQDHYPPEFAHCYGCGPANPHGLHLKSYLDDDGTVAMITPDPMFSGGVPGNLYGGMIASLLDCHGTASAAGFACRARGRRCWPRANCWVRRRTARSSGRNSPWRTCGGSGWTRGRNWRRRWRSCREHQGQHAEIAHFRAEPKALRPGTLPADFFR